ncbi:hypothetical protein Smp_197750 [Schistosoma mansoni]|nr:hypothetical protein Smp_197750 [Schistosoma mansoni]|eukprot:XP_018645542.1 hypothetical protein Smp_197750 [Schistosoma mansoni]
MSLDSSLENVERERGDKNNKKHLQMNKITAREKNHLFIQHTLTDR